MRWIKAMVITAIILAIIPTIVLSINKITEGSTKYVEYEIIITEENINETVYELYNLAKIDENNNVTNFLYVENKGAILNVTKFRYSQTYNWIEIIYLKGSQTYIIRLDLDDPVEGSNIDVTGTVKIVLYDEIVVEPSVSPTELLLISLIPLILVSGLLVYQYNELGLKIRKEWKTWQLVKNII